MITEEPIKRKAKDIKFSLFYPKSSAGLLNDHPELRGVDEFKSLSRNDLLFVWYYSCEVSPVIHYRPNRRVERALEYSYGDNIDLRKKNDYCSLNFPDKVINAISKMKTYKIGPRMRSRVMAENIMDNFEKIISVDVSSDEFLDEDGNTDWDKKNKYVSASINVSKNLSTIISQVEGGFGIVSSKDVFDLEEEEGMLDDYHDENL